MSNIASNISNLTVPEKIVKGQKIITMSTGNPNVPGNTAPLATLSAAQSALVAANNAAEEAREVSKQRTAARDTTLAAWAVAVTGLAAFTENATGGNADKILTTGFDVRADPVPPQPVEQIVNVKVSFNGTPGYSDVTWKREVHSDAYVVQCSPEPITDTSWKNSGTVTEPKFSGNGATPGQKCWYRVAGVNRLGQGPWSEPALRPVM
jgi:predicted phage tail protein